MMKHITYFLRSDHSENKRKTSMMMQILQYITAAEENRIGVINMTKQNDV
jgi:hypothetical protein